MVCALRNRIVDSSQGGIHEREDERMPFFPASQRYALPYRAIEMRRQAMLANAEAMSSQANGTERQANYACSLAPSNGSDRTTGEGSPVSTAMPPAAAQADFGAQGGDPSRSVDMDLSTCVNRYGPAPAAIAALHSIAAADILLHPYDAAEQLVDLYRWATGVQGGAMVAGRGASEFIWAMGRELDHADVHVPLPAYTDYLKAFPGRGFSMAGEQIPSVEQVDAALDKGGLVIISNPHNPTGTLLDPKGLAFRQVIWPQGSARIVAPAWQLARLRRVVVLLVRSR